MIENNNNGLKIDKFNSCKSLEKQVNCNENDSLYACEATYKTPSKEYFNPPIQRQEHHGFVLVPAPESMEVEEKINGLSYNELKQKASAAFDSGQYEEFIKLREEIDKWERQSLYNYNIII